MSERVKRFEFKEDIFVIDGTPYPRIPWGEGTMPKQFYGKEYKTSEGSNCPDCGIAWGSLHSLGKVQIEDLNDELREPEQSEHPPFLIQGTPPVPSYSEATVLNALGVLCDMEECPRCHIQAMSCSCWPIRSDNME